MLYFGKLHLYPPTNVLAFEKENNVILIYKIQDASDLVNEPK